MKGIKKMKKATMIIVLLSAVLILCSCITVNINGNNGQTTPAETKAETAADTKAETAAQTTEEATTAAETELEQTAQERTEEFFKSYSGYWTNEDGKFIFIGKDEKGAHRVSFGIWNAGGPFPTGGVSDVEKVNEKEFKMTVNIDALPDDPEWYGDGYEAYTYELAVKDVSDESGRKISAKYAGDDEISTFVFHTEPENPFLGA